MRYRSRRGTTIPIYACQRRGIENAETICQVVTGDVVDRAVGELLVETVTPLSLEVALAVQSELESRSEEADQMRKANVERARHAAELARRRYLTVDPDNRLVAATLEADWNDSLRQLSTAVEHYEHQSQSAIMLDDEQRAKIASIAADFPSLWSDPRTPQRERKRMVRLLLADVTLKRDGGIGVHVRFKGGQTVSLDLPRLVTAPDLRRTPAAVIAEIDRLLEETTDAGIANALNKAGVASGTGQEFSAGKVRHIRIAHGLTTREQRLRARGLVDVTEVAKRLGVCTDSVKRWAAEGRIASEVLHDRGDRLYQVPAVAPFKPIGRPLGPGRSRKAVVKDS